MRNQLLLETAFAYVESRKALSLDDVRQQLLRRGFTHAEVRQIYGAALSRQLRERIETAMSDDHRKLA